MSEEIIKSIVNVIDMERRAGNKLVSFTLDSIKTQSDFDYITMKLLPLLPGAVIKLNDDMSFDVIFND